MQSLAAWQAHRPGATINSASHLQRQGPKSRRLTGEDARPYQRALIGVQVPRWAKLARI